MRIVPCDKFDQTACDNLSSASDQAVIEQLDDLLEWLQDMNWPVASQIITRLKQIKEPLVIPIKKILRGNDDIWKYWIITALLSQTSPSVFSALEVDLQRLASHPTKREILEEVDIAAKDLLLKFRGM